MSCCARKPYAHLRIGYTAVGPSCLPLLVTKLRLYACPRSWLRPDVDSRVLRCPPRFRPTSTTWRSCSTLAKTLEDITVNFRKRLVFIVCLIDFLGEVNISTSTLESFRRFLAHPSCDIMKAVRVRQDDRPNHPQNICRLLHHLFLFGYPFPLACSNYWQAVPQWQT